MLWYASNKLQLHDTMPNFDDSVLPSQYTCIDVFSSSGISIRKIRLLSDRLILMDILTY